MIFYTPPEVPESIPVIDFSAERKAVAWEIHKACRETGFFYIANHGVEQCLIDAQFEVAKHFFALPFEQKLAIHMKQSAATAGYDPMGEQSTDSQDVASEKAPPDLKENFQCGVELPDDHPLVIARIRGYGHNQWPATLPEMRERTLAYQRALRALADRVLAAISLSLELPENYFAPFYDMPRTNTRMLHYPPHPGDAKFNQLGAGAHTDWGGITLLAQDSLGGLEVRKVDGSWIQATPVPGTFVVNLGDLMQRWSNDLYRSTMHRVKNDRSRQDRYSIAFFYTPRYDARIECLPGCSDGQNPAKYPPIEAQTHLNEMFRRSYGYEPTA